MSRVGIPDSACTQFFPVDCPAYNQPSQVASDFRNTDFTM